MPARRTDPPGGTGFTFTTDLPDGPFALDHGQLQTFDAVAPGTYTVTETDLPTTPGSPVLTDVVCVETGTQDSFGTLATRTATINLESGETVTCTFTNAPLDIDGDGVFNTLEDGAPNGGDGNGDGPPMTFPSGFFGFVTGLTGSRATVTLTLPDDVLTVTLTDGDLGGRRPGG
jgi:hypothetical protein